ncbi:MAG: hypothetical protein MUE49_04720 [Rhodospirillales bacterium]|nr:hypothetical protein [Rhodospirillales bacterium]
MAMILSTGALAPPRRPARRCRRRCRQPVVTMSSVLRADVVTGVVTMSSNVVMSNAQRVEKKHNIFRAGRLCRHLSSFVVIAGAAARWPRRDGPPDHRPAMGRHG